MAGFEVTPEGLSFATKQTMGLGATLSIPFVVSLCLLRMTTIRRALSFVILFVIVWAIEFRVISGGSWRSDAITIPLRARSWPVIMRQQRSFVAVLARCRIGRLGSGACQFARVFHWVSSCLGIRV